MRRLSRAEALAAISEPGACGVCAMASGAAVVDESPHAVTIVAPFAARPWHLVVLLRHHAERVASLPLEVWLDLQAMAHGATGALERVRRPRHFYVATLGSAEPRRTSFPHVHTHVVPLEDGGEADRPAAVFTWQDGVWVYDEGERDEIARQLREAILTARSIRVPRALEG